MPTVTYRPPDILHWFSTGSQEAIDSALRKGRALTKSAAESSVKQNIIRAAGVAADIGRGAAAEVLHRQAVDTVYKLHDEQMDVRGATGTRTIAYESITAILLHPKDRFTVEYGEGTLTVRPIAHLSAGKVRVPVGWVRNEIEVPFSTLLDELSARSDVEIEPA
ncbi:MAG: hypothetical protein IH945_00925 [Armatimonadetes bacterium]|nr:hypothetical protein [Armatimonadota bacterium]